MIIVISIVLAWAVASVIGLCIAAKRIPTHCTDDEIRAWINQV